MVLFCFKALLDLFDSIKVRFSQFELGTRKHSVIISCWV